MESTVRRFCGRNRILPQAADASAFSAVTAASAPPLDRAIAAASDRLREILDLARPRHRLRQIAAGNVVADGAQDAACRRHRDREPGVGIEDRRAYPVEAGIRER